MEPSPLKTWIIYGSIIALVVILLDEGAYYVWRQRNRGEHWSHVTEKTPLQNWETARVVR